MKTSENLSNIAAALCKAQAEMPVAPQDAKNDHLRNKYATLGSIISTASPVLARHGLSFIQMPSEAETGYMALTTRILHESGEWIEDTMRAAVPASKLSEIQSAGSVISYLRRYALSAALGIMTADDDGAAASQPRQQARPAPARQVSETDKPLEVKPSGEVVAINRALTADFGFKASERENAISFVAYLAGVPNLSSTKDLTEGQARGVLSKLNARTDKDSRSELVGKWADFMAGAGAA